LPKFPELRAVSLGSADAGGVVLTITLPKTAQAQKPIKKIELKSA
jgi:hypothetical protein